jgi:hypothetical protein
MGSSFKVFPEGKVRLPVGFLEDKTEIAYRLVIVYD